MFEKGSISRWFLCGAFTLAGFGCSDDDDGGIKAGSAQEACELRCEQYQECYPGDFGDWFVDMETCKSWCDPEKYIEDCQAACQTQYDGDDVSIEACSDQCVYSMYETGEEYCQEWCTEGGGDCDYCDEIWNDECQSAYLDYDNCTLSLTCDQLEEDESDYCDNERDAVIEACDNF